MFRHGFRMGLLLALLGMAGPSVAQEEGAEPEWPEPVAKLVQALSGVEQVEPAEDGTFIVKRRVQETGSRIYRDVEMRVNDKGEVVDWGDTPFWTRKYTLAELESTGESDLARALSKLDPAVNLN